MYQVEVAPYVPYDQGAPRLNTPLVYGAEPNKPFLYTFPTVGERPLRFSIDGALPEGLTLDAARGLLSGVAQSGEYDLVLHAQNRLGEATKPLHLSIGAEMGGRTPLMGWCSWNAFREDVTQADIEHTAELLVSTGLSSYGYQYVNLDSGWQGRYRGDAIAPNEKFPDMAAMYRHIHELGLKGGIYNTPMLRAWGSGEAPGCTRGRPDPQYYDVYYGVGRDHCEPQNVKQWAAWGIDYLKYDWAPCDPENAERMKACLRDCGRQVLFCCTVSAGIAHAEYWKNNCCSWRANADSRDTWENVLQSKFQSDFWAEHIQPGHFFDMDMLEIGLIREGETSFASRLTPDEKLVAYTMRALFPSPIQISCDLNGLLPEEMALLCNEEVIAINQDPLAIGAVCVREERERELDWRESRHTRVYLRPLSGHRVAAGLFNLSDSAQTVTLPLAGRCAVRDAWAKKDLPDADGSLSLLIPAHSVRLLTLNA